MDAGAQIDNVQSFFKVIGEHDGFWELLIRKKVFHFVKGYLIINAVNYVSREIVVLDLERPIRYKKEVFIQEFGSIEPPLFVQFSQINPSLSHKEFIDLIQIGQIERQEAERRTQEAEKREAEIREAQRKEAERREAQRKEAEIREAQRREAERQEAQRKEAEIREAQRKEAERQEAQRKEAEIREAQRRELQKQTLLKSLKAQFNHNFLNAHKFYRMRCSKYLSHEEYQTEKSHYVQSWVQYHLKSESDLEQASAIGAIEGHVQVVARAGSGKTSTLVNRALFLQKHCGIAPNEMLLLAFNKKAAEEIKERLASKLQSSSIPHIMTFHALAYSLVHPENILCDVPDGEQNKSRALQRVIDDYLRNPDYYEEIRALMMAHFREDWERIVVGGFNKSPEEMLRYRRSLPKEGLDGTYFKSFGEKVIGDFLFEHNIKYKYERNFWWNDVNYRPDFTIFTRDNPGVVIEYFGLQGDPDYDAMSEQKRQYWDNNPNWDLLEFSPQDLKYDGIKGFCALLKQSLLDYGVICDRLSEEEIWQRVNEKNRAIDRFTKVVVGFIQRCRKLALTPDELAQMIYRHKDASGVEERFLELVQAFYKSYLERLQETGEEDFDGLMQKAAAIVASGETVFRRKSGNGDLKRLRYILIDEYQDFSKLFHDLIESVREQNPQVYFFCVGDDWQAINGFAGSDLRYYQNFAQFFQPCETVNIATNYRSAKSIVDVGNTLMQKLGTPARANKSESGIVKIVDLETFTPTLREQELHRGDELTPVVLRLVKNAVDDGKDVVLLTRKNSLPYYVNCKNELDSFLKLVRSYLPQESKNKVTISTAHKYKGLEKKVVIVLDAVPRCYPLLHPDLMFTRVFGDSIEQVVDEERRLFYVALTRAVEQLFIITEKNNVSPFLEELKCKKILFVNWSDYPPLAETIKRIIVRVGNQDGKGGSGTFAIKDLLGAEGYSWNNVGWKAWCRTYAAEEFSVEEFFNNAIWISRANGIEVRFHDDLEKLLAIYRVDRGQWTCVVNNIPELKITAINIYDDDL